MRRRTQSAVKQDNAMPWPLLPPSLPVTAREKAERPASLLGEVSTDTTWSKLSLPPVVGSPGPGRVAEAPRGFRATCSCSFEGTLPSSPETGS
eukprot:scaffold69116_cov32-Tisochrysis_lutea.AAC.4